MRESLIVVLDEYSPGGKYPKSPSYTITAFPSCFRLDVQAMACAFLRAAFRAGRRSAARIAMIAITTRSSIIVKCSAFVFMFFAILFSPDLIFHNYSVKLPEKQYSI